MARRRKSAARRFLELVFSRESAALLALMGGVGWLHAEFASLDRGDVAHGEEIAQLRADQRALRLELSNCRRMGEQ